MTDRQPTIFWPLGLLPILLPSLAIALITYASTLPMLSWPYQEWVRTSAEFHQQNALAAPIAAAAATYYAGRLTPSSRIFALPCAPRVGQQIVGRHCLTLIGCFLTAYLAGLAPLIITTIRTAEQGRPEPLVILTGLLGLVAAIIIGYFIGVIGKSSLLTPVSFILLFGVAMAGSYGDTFAAVAPVLHIGPRLGYPENFPLVIYRIIFLSTVIGTFLVASIQTLKHFRQKISRSLINLTVLSVPLILVIPPLLYKPALFTPEVKPPQVCTTQSSIKYCVHSGHKTQLASLVKTFDPIFKLYGTQSPIAQVYDDALRGNHKRTDTAWVQLHPENSTINSSSVTSLLAGSYACTYRPGKNSLPLEKESATIASDVAIWLGYHGQVPAAGFPFYGIPLTTMQKWISEHRESLINCTLTKKDLPR